MTSDGYFTHTYPHCGGGWVNWVSPTERPDATIGSVAQIWYQKHDFTYIHPGEHGLHVDGFGPYYPSNGAERFAAYWSKSVWAVTKQELTPIKETGLLPGLSQQPWTGKLAEDAAVRYEVYSPGQAAPIATGELSRANSRVVQGAGILPDGAAIVIHSGKGCTLRVKGDSIGYAFYVDRGKGNAELRLAPRSDAPVPAKTRFDWSYDIVEQVVSNPCSPDITWLTVKRGTLRDHYVGATLRAQDRSVALTVNPNPLAVNSSPFIIEGVSDNWTCGLLELNTGRFRPVGTVQGTAYVQVAASSQNLELVVGNVLVADNADIRITATQNTDRDGRPTGEWLVEVHNPTAVTITTTLKPGTGFESLFNTASRSVSVPAGSSVNEVMP
jgi:hypothetical protein